MYPPPPLSEQELEIANDQFKVIKNFKNHIFELNIKPYRRSGYLVSCTCSKCGYQMVYDTYGAVYSFLDHYGDDTGDITNSPSCEEILMNQALS